MIRFFARYRAISALLKAELVTKSILDAAKENIPRGRRKHYTPALRLLPRNARNAPHTNRSNVRKRIPIHISIQDGGMNTEFSTLQVNFIDLVFSRHTAQLKNNK